MSQRLNNLNDLIATLKTGAGYYRKAARQTGKAENRVVFVEHAEIRESYARQLAGMVEEVGGEVRDLDAREKGREIAGRVGAFIGDTDRTLIDSLEDHEDRTLDLFRTAVHHADNARDEPTLRDMMNHLEATHQRMRTLKDDPRADVLADEPKQA
ncbi:DUF2383 domain-containing protein [Roseisalinus antarcticus]|uniref:DUF2383 domain-containing protein n=1 Tax=Roseisalinus antarcticus TaxID=254357 RepID=A0A1Y5TYF6_9RHOB|nr:DUF2383 domain-containing protein [Roseisalinus antarcticus]SLN71557.1 hypothetical protein ROA7023_03521 [Roseisalinus antarcticus]